MSAALSSSVAIWVACVSKVCQNQRASACPSIQSSQVYNFGKAHLAPSSQKSTLQVLDTSCRERLWASTWSLQSMGAAVQGSERVKCLKKLDRSHA